MNDKTQSNTNTINMADAANTAPIAAPAMSSSEGTDISKTTITVLVLLTLMISIIGTWTVMSEISSAKVVQQEPARSTGQIRFSITEAPPPKTATGNVALDIRPSVK
jgi:hypothetical protein